MWSPFSLFRSDNSQSTAPTSSTTTSSSQRIQTKVIIDAEKSAGEYTILLLRRIRRWLNLQRRIHPYMISAILITTTALGITFSYKWCICRKQQQQQKQKQCMETGNETSLGSWKLRWSWIPPFMRIVDNRAGDEIKTNEGSCFNNLNNNNNNNNNNQTRRKCPFLFTSAPVVEDDDINFIDATESAFRMFQRRVERTHEAPLLRALSELETLGEEWRSRNNSQKTVIPTEDNNNNNNTMNSDNNNNISNNNNNNHTVITEEEKEDTLRDCIRQKAIETDELLTQFIVQLDLAPVGDSAALKKERKALITSAAALADRIAVWMYLSPQVE